MKFPFISIEPLIDQVKSELKTMNQQGNISADDCYMWAVDVAREIAIGEDGLDETTSFIRIKNRAGHVPKNFYVAKEIWRCSHRELTNYNHINSIGATQEFFGWERTNIMRPGDSQTLRYCHRSFANPGISPSDQSYIIRVPPGTIRTSFDHGVIQLVYYHLRTDDEGLILIPDEIHTKKAIINYIKYKLFEEKFYLGEVNATIYQLLKEQYEDELNLAKQIMKFDNPQDNIFEALAMSNKYRRFKI